MLSSCVSFFGKKNQTLLQHKSQPKYLKFSLPSRGEYRPLSVTGNTTALTKEKTNLEGAKTGILEGVLFGFGLDEEGENSDDIIGDLSEQECLEFLKDLRATETHVKDKEEKEQVEEVIETTSGEKGTRKHHQRTAKEEEEFQIRVERQIELEVSARANAANKYQQLLEQLHHRRIGANLKPAEALTVCWFQPLVKAIEEEHKAIMNKESGVDRGAYGPYLISLSPAKLAVIAIHDLVSLLLSDPQGVSFTPAAYTIGSSVHAEVCFEKLQKKTKLIKRLKLSGPLTPARINKYSKKAIESSEWSPKVLVKVGAVLVKLLVETAQIPSFVQERLQLIQESATSDHSRIRFKPIKLTPSHLLNTNNTFAFSHEQETAEGKRKKVGKIVCDNWVMEFIFQEHKLREMVNVRYLPMCLPPKPWKGIKKGIYYHPQSEVSLMRFKAWPKQVTVLQEAHEKKKLSSLYHGLNLLSSVAWKINSAVFQTVKQAWDLGGGIADLPPKTNQPHPEKPSDFDENETAKKNWWNHFKKIDRHNQDLHSLRCDTNLKLKVASEFLHEKEIFFPHNIDFRGRCYPIPPHLNHMGSDLCRGILSFANGKPLGHRGLYWLMIQLASLKGMDKISFEQREEYTKKHINKVMDSARNPLEGERWWLQSDDPWQTLATCCEIAMAVESKDPSLFVSSLPVHQDGSCNGLQHYAALGGDYLGAVSVNLVPNNTPQDVYSQVAQLVSKMVKEDAEKENLEIAKLLDGRVERKIVKQTIMTSVYGVTFVGARQQIRNAIKDRKLFDDDATIIEASLYLTKKTFSALREMFLGAREIMDWFTKCAQIIGKQKGQPTEWTTPLHLPVVQPYGKSKATVIKTVVQNVALPSVGEKKVTVGRQKSAFPPNYIHSLDSTHMFFTAFECAEKGITFAAVHDSFWTHACDVDEMNQILRKQFVRLHQMDLLGQLKAEFEQRYPDLKFPDLPKKGDLDLKQVLKSPYFFH